MLKTTTVSLLILACLLSSVGSLSAQPRKLFGDDGALIWVPSYTYIGGLIPVNGGEQVIAFATSARPEDSRHVIYRQTYNLDGTTVEEAPILFTPAEMISNNAVSCADLEGSHYLGYLLASPDDRTDLNLHIHKFNSAGEELWGDGFVTRFEADTADVPNPPVGGTLIPDDRGGCYYLSDFGYFAIGSDGQLRQYELQGLLPENEFGTYVSPSYDGAGGFWLRSRNPNLGQFGEVVWERLRYDGSRVFGEYRQLTAELGEEVYEISIAFGFNGGAFCTLDGRRSVGLIDGDGQLISDNHLHRLPQDWRQNGSITRTMDGGLIFILENNERDSVETSRINVSKYFPAENNFPWGIGGVEIARVIEGENDPRNFEIRTLPFETSEGNILVGYSHDVYNADTANIHYTKISTGGDLISDANVIVPMSRINQVVQAPDDGFWIFGKLERSYGTDVLTRLDSRFQSAFEHTVGLGFLEVPGFNPPTISETQNGSMNFIFPSRNGFRRICVSQDGSVTTPIGGELELEANWVYGSYITLRLNNITYYLWQTDTNNLAKLSSFDQDGNHCWTTDIQTGNNFDTGRRSLIAGPGGNSILVSLMNTRTVRFDDFYTPYLLKIDPHSGELLWTWHQPEVNGSDDMGQERAIKRYIYVANDSIYDLMSVQGVSSSLYKITSDARSVWHRRMPNEALAEYFVTGIAPADNGGVYVAFCHDAEDSFAVWVQKVESNSVLTDSIPFFDGYIQNLSPDEYRSPSFRFIRSRNNLWLFKTQGNDDSTCIVQGMDLEGNTYWINGIIPPSQNGRSARTINGASDGAGGLWFLYYYAREWDAYGPPYALWFPADGSDPEGPVCLVDNPVRAHLSSFTVMDNGDLVTISTHAPEQIRHYPNYYACSLQRLRHPLELSTKEPLPAPEKFEITATYPNPFNSRLIVKFNLPAPGAVGIEIVDITGRVVSSNEISRFGSGEGRAYIDGSSLASGVYYLRLSSDNLRRTAKVVMIK